MLLPLNHRRLVWAKTTKLDTCDKHLVYWLKNIFLMYSPGLKITISFLSVRIRTYQHFSASSMNAWERYSFSQNAGFSSREPSQRAAFYYPFVERDPFHQLSSLLTLELRIYGFFNSRVDPILRMYLHWFGLDTKWISPTRCDTNVL